MVLNALQGRKEKKNTGPLLYGVYSQITFQSNIILYINKKYLPAEQEICCGTGFS